MNEAERKFKEKGTVSKRFSLPYLFWEEWAKDCKENHNDTYYLKMQSDHTYKKDMQVFIDSIIVDMIALKGDLLELKQIVQELKQNTNKQSEVTTPKVTKTLG